MLFPVEYIKDVILILSFSRNDIGTSSLSCMLLDDNKNHIKVIFWLLLDVRLTTHLVSLSL